MKFLNKYLNERGELSEKGKVHLTITIGLILLLVAVVGIALLAIDVGLAMLYIVFWLLAFLAFYVANAVVDELDLKIWQMINKDKKKERD